MFQNRNNTNKKNSISMFYLLACCFICFFSFFNQTVSHALASDEARTIIILDGSRSMWGRMGRLRKYQHSTAAVEKILAHKGAKAPIGVMAFGHLRRNNCQTLEMIKSPDQPMSEDVQTKLKNYRPRSVAPISRALEVAARELDHENRAARIIMIVDGPDQCRRDPCKTLEELRKTSYDLSVRIIGLNLSKRNRKRFQCFSEHKTDALHLVRNSKDLLTALFLATGKDEETGVKQAYKRPEVKEDQITSLLKGSPRIKLLAVLAEGMPPLREGISWKIYKAINDRTFRSKPVATTSNAQPLIPLKPGNYIAEAHYGQVISELAVQVPKTGSLTHVLNLNAGVLEVQTKEKSDGDVLEGVFYTLYEFEDGSQPGRVPLARSNDPTPKFRVKAGKYMIVASHGGNSLQQEVMIQAGESAKISLEMKTGLLKLVTYAAKSSPPLDRILYSVFKYDSNIKQEDLQAGDEVTRTAAAKPILRLPAGRYVVKAEHDLASAYLHVYIKPGQTTEANVILNAATLFINSTATTKKQPLKDRISYRIYSLSTKPVEIARTTSPEKTYILSPGKYRVTSRYGSINAKANLDLTLRPGEKRNVLLVHDAGTAHLSLYDKGGKYPRVNVFWTLFDHLNNEVWRTSRPTPQMVLKSGKYKIQVESGPKRFEREFEVKKGKKTEIRIEATD